jgi:hypothetical protein
MVWLDSGSILLSSGSRRLSRGSITCRQSPSEAASGIWNRTEDRAMRDTGRIGVTKLDAATSPKGTESSCGLFTNSATSVANRYEHSAYNLVRKQSANAGVPASAGRVRTCRLKAGHQRALTNNPGQLELDPIGHCVEKVIRQRKAAVP